jgi:hypothetical protein
MTPDLFGESAVRSFPPHLDPARVASYACAAEPDRDHVGEAEIGRYGNNRCVYVVRVFGRGGGLLHAEQWPTRGAADAAMRRIECALEANRQTSLAL